ncbi:MAG: hypothetical protein LLG01_12060 [Planctomycetaceae bacterium]|nr:hypothetical protein [Planctomycetaceae bacterium]
MDTQQATDNVPGSTPLSRRRTIPKVVIVFAVAALLACKPDLFIEGLLGYGPLTIAYLFPLLLLVAFLVAIGAAYLLGRLIWKFVRWRKVRFFTTLSILSLWLVAYCSPSPFWVDSYLRGLRLWAQGHIDVPSVCQWTQTYSIPQGSPQGEYQFYHVPIADLPPALGFLAARVDADYPDSSSIDQPSFIFNEEKRQLRVGWGAGRLGSWGVTIGKDASDEGYPEFQISQDAYVWKQE